MSDTFTLKRLNQLIVAVGLPPLTPAQAGTLVGLEPRDRIVSAAERVGQDQNSRGWLTALFRRSGLLEPATPVSPPSEPPAQTGSYVDGSGSGRTGFARPAPEAVSAPAADTAPAALSDRSPVASEGQGGGLHTNPGHSRVIRDDWHVYARKAALSFEADETRGGKPTVALDAALASGPRQYDWSTKIRIQLSLRELPIVAAVLLGLIGGCEFSAHGEGNSKGFSIEYQEGQGGGNYFIRVWSKDVPQRAVPMDAADAYYVGDLLLRQMARLSPSLAPAERNLLLKRVASSYKKPARAA
jgi:hypothetical protein